jgi:predicted dithiol-disulfide oxidoreductase (DUF899 family)
MSSVRFPGESKAYREARDKLLVAELELRRQVEAVAALRRTMPLGGEVPEDYAFEEGGNDSSDVETVRTVRLSELFAPGKDALLLYSYMYGPAMKQPCPLCTSMLDGLDGQANHVKQRANLAVVAQSPIKRIRELARGRGWHNMRLLSAAKNGYQRVYQGEDEKGGQNPTMNVFVRRDGRVHHFWCCEVLFNAPHDGLDSRHIDQFWPLWHLLDLTPDGRGKDFYPKLSYT